MSTSLISPTPPLTADPGARADVSTSARVSFRQPVSESGFVDAAWWPRSRDLRAELPALLDVLWTSCRDITRVMFNSAAWEPVPRRIRIGDRLVRLGAFTVTDPLLVRLMDPWGRERVDVLVIAPETDPVVAARALEIAGHADNLLRPADIMLAAT